MKHLDGWRRLLIVLSSLWILTVFGLTVRDYEVVDRDGNTTVFVGLQDSNTGKSFGSLTRKEIQRLAELLERSAHSSNAEPRDTEDAAYLLAVQLQPKVRMRNVSMAILVPVALLWFLYICAVWVIAGFKQRAQ